MDHGRAHSLLATVVTDPGFLSELSPSARRSLTDDVAGGRAGQDNIRAIMKFAGLVTKVRHNQLHEFVPLSLRALQCLSLEIEFFSFYAPVFSKMWQRRPLTLEFRLEHFARNLRAFLNVGIRSHAFVAEILSHELRLIRLRSRQIPAAPARSSNRKPNGHSRPIVDGAIEIPAMRWNPADIGSMTDAASILNRVRRRSHSERYYAYLSRCSDGNIEFFELDAITARILALLSKETTVQEIATALAGETGSKVRCADILAMISTMAAFIPIRLASNN
jgi:hypothetical protein